MLQELSIKNFAVIKDLDVHFNEGMTVLTGETGAGKSIIIDAVQLLTGGRGSAHFVRYGEDKSQLQALFTVEDPTGPLVQLLADQGIDLPSQELVIQRDIYENGRQVSRINGTLVTIGLLKEVGAYLVDISGQNNQQSLMNPDQHLPLLDAFGGPALQQKKEAYQQAYTDYRAKKKRLDQWQDNQQELNQKLDMLSFQLEELQAAQLHEGEDEALDQERNQLMNFQTIQTALQEAYNGLAGNPHVSSSVDQIGQAADHLAGIADWGEDYAALADQLNGAYYQLQDIQSALYDAIEGLDYDPSNLNHIEERLDLINRLKRKYGPTLEDVMAFHQRAAEEWQALNHNEEDRDQWKEDLDQAGEVLVSRGVDLAEDRRQLARDLEDQIHQQLADLYMEKARFQVVFSKDLSALTLADAGPQGLEEVAFYVATNPGEPLKPLDQVASGGEVSRMMLAIKTLFAEKQGVATNILDEVDTGVSGRVASAIAQKIKSISLQQQVLCISHLPQVAAQADHHLYISKRLDGDRTTTSARYLDEADKLAEIAQMLSGDATSPTALQTAKELRQASLEDKDSLK